MSSTVVDRLRPGTVIREGVLFERQRKGRRGRHLLIARYDNHVLIPIEGKGQWPAGAHHPRPGQKLPVRIVESDENCGRKRYCAYAG